MISSPSEPIEAVITRFHQPPRPRCGDRSRRLWWVCPFHDDRNPSLCVQPGASHYHCFGCGAHGDAIDFVRRLDPNLSFQEALRAIGGQPPRTHKREPGGQTPAARREPEPRPEGWPEFAREVVETAEAVLWSDQGAQARSYLAQRGLSEATIRTARLGYCPEDRWVQGIFPDQEVWVPGGIVLPWLDGPDVTLINIRRPEGQPKYLAVKGSQRGGIYPGRSGIVRGKPLVIVEGEFDALLLGQELDGLSAVATLGSASDRPKPRVLNALLKASPWIIASDADDAGERSAENWLALSERSVRVAPPQEHGKDWTDSYQNGLDLRAWWLPVLDRLTHESSPPPRLEDHRLLPPPDPLDRLSEGFSEVEGVIVQEPTLWPWREPMAWWSDEWRLRWGGLANAHIAAGMPWQEAEARATAEVSAEREAACGGPPPVMDPDPYTVFWRDWLTDLIDNGEVARSLPPAQLHRAQTFLAGEPLDCNALRSVVLKVRGRVCADRYRSLGIPHPAGVERRWRCLNPFCLHKGGWWKSAQGVINCRNCCPPAIPSQVVAEGDASDAPSVNPDRSHQAVAASWGIRFDLTGQSPEPESLPTIAAEFCAANPDISEADASRGGDHRPDEPASSNNRDAE